MAYTRALVRIDSISIPRTEDVGEESEWRLQIQVDGGGQGGSYVWANDQVRNDGGVYPIQHDFYIPLPSPNSSITIRTSGREKDTTSGDDALPSGEMTLMPSQIDARTHQLTTSNDEFEYTLYFTVTGMEGQPLTADASWSEWEFLGGVFVDAPSVASWADNRLDVFVRGTNDCMMHRWWDGSSWSEWEDLGGELSSGPAAVSWGSNRIDCFIRDKNGELSHRWCG